MRIPTQPHPSLPLSPPAPIFISNSSSYYRREVGELVGQGHLRFGCLKPSTFHHSTNVVLMCFLSVIAKIFHNHPPSVRNGEKNHLKKSFFCYPVSRVCKCGRRKECHNRVVLIATWWRCYTEKAPNLITTCDGALQVRSIKASKLSGYGWNVATPSVHVRMSRIFVRQPFGFTPTGCDSHVNAENRGFSPEHQRNASACSSSRMRPLPLTPRLGLRCRGYQTSAIEWCIFIKIIYF